MHAPEQRVSGWRVEPPSNRSSRVLSASIKLPGGCMGGSWGRGRGGGHTGMMSLRRGFELFFEGDKSALRFERPGLKALSFFTVNNAAYQIWCRSGHSYYLSPSAKTRGLNRVFWAAPTGLAVGRAIREKEIGDHMPPPSCPGGPGGGCGAGDRWGWQGEWRVAPKPAVLTRICGRAPHPRGSTQNRPFSFSINPPTTCQMARPLR